MWSRNSLPNITTKCSIQTDRSLQVYTYVVYAEAHRMSLSCILYSVLHRCWHMKTQSYQEWKRSLGNWLYVAWSSHCPESNSLYATLVTTFPKSGAYYIEDRRSTILPNRSESSCLSNWWTEGTLFRPSATFHSCTNSSSTGRRWRISSEVQPNVPTDPRRRELLCVRPFG